MAWLSGWCDGGGGCEGAVRGGEGLAAGGGGLKLHVQLFFL